MGGDDLSSVRENDLTMVMPKGSVSGMPGQPLPGPKRPGHAQSASIDDDPSPRREDEGFTMVIPTLRPGPDCATPAAQHRSPLKQMFDDARERFGANERVDTHLSPPREAEKEAHERKDRTSTTPRSGSPVKPIEGRADL